jgi:peptidoglycan/xylan/chitin deacetylase (PgdA/CDA1 family)
MSRAPVVLAYHAIGTAPRGAALYNTFVSRTAFERQVRFLERRHGIVSLQTALGGGGGVAITFDDAYRSVLEQAVPVLRERKLPATVFVPTKWIGSRNGWDPPNDLPLDIMGREEIAELAALGFEIGSHGHAHADLSVATPDEAREDIETSVQILEQILGARPRYLAYPYGRGSAAADDAARALGIEATFSLEHPAAGSQFERIPVYPLDRGPLFASKASGRYLAWRRSRAVAWAYELVRPVLRRRGLWP